MATTEGGETPPANGSVDDDFPGRMLHQAAIYNNVDFLEDLLEGEEVESINEGDPFGRTALYTAVTNNSLECARMLLQAGANPNIACGPQCGLMTPLHAAALADKHAFLHLLLRAGADLDLTDASGEKPLDLAVKNRSDECVHIIVKEIERRESEKSDQEKSFLEACMLVQVDKAKQLARTLSKDTVKRVINSCQDGQHSLLHSACENGDAAMARFLLENGAECKVHQVTGSSPLHAASQGGHAAAVRTVLQYYPELVQFSTIEGMLPLHMAATEGHANVVNVILNFPYPSRTRQIYRNETRDCFYKLGFPVNAKEGRGHTLLHLACLHNKHNVVHQLLKFRVRIVNRENLNTSEEETEELNGHFGFRPQVGEVDSGQDVREATEEMYSQPSPATSPGPPGASPHDTFNPIDIDCLDLDGCTPLHLAVKGDGRRGFHQVARMLLEHDANPNKPIISPSGNSSALMEACLAGDVAAMDLLLWHKAQDTDLKVLAAATAAQDEGLAGTLLKYRSYQDCEFKVNKPALLSCHCELGEPNAHALAVKPTAINWHALCLPDVSAAWLHEAALLYNPTGTLRLALFAITRIDVSRNSLTRLPVELFTLKSLRLLNMAENQLAGLPGDTTGDDLAVVPFCGAADPASMALDCPWDLPYLEEIQCYKNKLRTLPPGLFELPALKRLNLAYNLLERLPCDMWRAPCLLELNLAHNLLRDLPACLATPEVGGPVDLASETGLEDSPPPGSVPGTPQTALTAASSTSSGSGRGSGSGASERDAGPGDAEPLLVGPGRPYTEQEVEQVSLWKDRLCLRMAFGFTEPADGARGSVSVLQELNLSHNLFGSVPAGLPCLVPALSKLVLAHNRLSHVGACSAYPAGLKLLDLAHNAIFSHALFDCAVFDEEHYGERWASRVCYNPSGRRQASSGRSSTASSGGLSVPGTPAARCGAGHGAAPATSCPHRSHLTLDQLKTLKLDHNKLSALTLTLDTGEMFPSDPEPPEDLTRSPSKASLRHVSAEAGRGGLLYPELTVLDAGHNQLGVLPTEISGMTGLTELKLGHNRLKDLPPEMGLLRKLWNLDVCGCPVERSLQSLLGDKAKKTAAVLGYLKSIKDEATLYNRMKLMFVGIQGIGKTSLLAHLRKEGRSSSKNKNWAQRMGHSSMKDKDLKGENISTVGVDIGDLVLSRGNKEIIFSTWDFGGQKEYYATHQYFLSKRSLYLVCWKVTDGEKGVVDMMQWMVNIQARAPNSPVIIVGTHLDMITKRRYPPSYLDDLQALIYDRYMKHSEPEKWGLPRVIGHVEVSCKPTLMSRSHIGDLVQLIHRVAFEEQWPGSKGVKLVEQKVPASYVHLQDVVRDISEERKMQGKDPVLHTEQYRMLVMSRMEAIHKSSFRDIAELNQATQFLHENGVLLHYDDVSLQDVYFLDPQWLCDMMANVVTIREINSLAKSGIMRTEDLRLQFKNAAFKPEDIRTYIIDLLNKFEVALQWDDDNLLIPSLLPTEEDMWHKRPFTDIRIPVRGSSVAYQAPRYGSGKTAVVLPGPECSPPVPWQHGNSTFYVGPPPDAPLEDGPAAPCTPSITNRPNPAVALVRLYLMAYFPSGFWSRLITRLLGDSTLYNLVLSLYDLPDVLTTDPHFMHTRGAVPEWKCWQSGVELRHLDVVLVRLREAPRHAPGAFCDYRQCQMVMRREEVEGGVALLNLNSTTILEVLFPNESITIDFSFGESGSGGLESLVVQPSPQVTAGLLVKVVDHIDTLLEDWYPDLGARFIQNSRGMYLITRIVPCTRCVLQQKERQAKRAASVDAWSMVDLNPHDESACITEPVFIQPRAAGGACPAEEAREEAEDGGQRTPPPEQHRIGSAPAGGTTWVDSVYSSGFKVVQTVGSLYNKTAEATGLVPRLDRNQIFVFTVEQCILATGAGRCTDLCCPRHGLHTSAASIDPIMQLAPDVVFQDIGDEYHIDPDQIWLGQILGRGAFGAVFAGSMVDKRSGDLVDIAMKMLQPVDPGLVATSSQRQQYNAERQRWEKDPMKSACEAYLNARKELSILLSLHHTHIVPLLGVALQPLCLVLSLAPKGALSSCLREYRRAGARLPVTVIQAVIIQVSAALAYLHSCQIIYRDLKSENVLVWRLPAPGGPVPAAPVHVKLADYGVSRSVLPAGAKGFAGTPPFIAPEIIQHNGEESYTEKVDCFSFGMFIYELLMLRHPFEDGDSGAAAVANLKGHILAGGRPPITYKELIYPNHVLDLMTLCWSHDPGDRPSAEQIRSIAESAEFAYLQDVVTLGTDGEAVCACASPSPYDTDQLTDTCGDGSEGLPCSDVWTSVQAAGETGRVSIHTYHDQRCIQKKSIKVDSCSLIVCMCLAGDYMWLADSAGTIHIFKYYSEVLKFPVTTTPNVHVRAMVYGACEKHVFVVMDTGRLVICGTSLPSNLSSTYTPVRTECPGNGKPIHCLAVLSSSKGSSELWCGQARGQVRVWNLHTTSGSMRVLNHPGVTSDAATVVHVVTDSSPLPASSVSSPVSPTTPAAGPAAPARCAVWSYVYPGTEVYRWDTQNQTVQGWLDLSSILPAADTFTTSLLHGDQLIAPKCQVTAMCVVGPELLVGTTLGCIVVADSLTMHPLRACRSHSDVTPYVQSLVPLLATAPGNTPGDMPRGTPGDAPGDMPGGTPGNAGTLRCTGVVSFGKGYSSVVTRHVKMAPSHLHLEAETALLSWTLGTWHYRHDLHPHEVNAH